MSTPEHHGIEDLLFATLDADLALSRWPEGSRRRGLGSWGAADRGQGPIYSHHGEWGVLAASRGHWLSHVQRVCRTEAGRHGPIPPRT